MSEQSTICTRAETSFHLGLWSFFVSFFTGIPAIVLGLRGLWDIQRSGGQLTGNRFAIVGIGTGAVTTMVGATLLGLGVANVRDAADRAH